MPRVPNAAGGTKPGRKPPSSVVGYWLNEIASAKRREKQFRKDGERILKIYDGSKSETNPFNILFSNTETLLPAVYSAVPRPVVQRRFKDSDPLGKSAAEAGQRVLEFLLDTNIEGYETFDEAMRAAALDGLLPGRGVTCVKYDADIGLLDEEPDPAEGDEDQAQENTDSVTEEASEKEPTPYKKSELVCIDSRSWNRVYFGYARKWSKVPWIAYEESIDKDEAVRLFGADKASKLRFSESDERDSEDDDKDEEKNKGARKTTCVYQIWDREGGRKIRYVSAQYPDGYLAELDDPLGLTGFFNCPKPLQFIEKANDLKPTALYLIYENQAKELNNLTVRINRVVKAIKAKAIYDGGLGDDVKRLVEADDNMLVPAETASTLSAEKGMSNAIWFWPIEQLIAVLVQLYNAREQCKRVIYEITGISDIIRGSSVASETATAQNIKSQWGTLRLKRLQKEVQRYSRDVLRMMLEIAAAKFSEDTWAKMTGLPFVTTDQRAQLDAVAAAAQQAGQQLDPQTQAGLQQPVWGQVLSMLRDDMQRAYRIDIETNSTIEPEAAEDQKNITDLIASLGQFLQGVGPLVVQGAMPFEAAKAVMLTIARRFRFGPEIEDDLKAMQPPAPPDQADKQAQAMEAQQKQQEGQLKLQQLQAQIEADAMRAKADMARAQADIEKLQLEMQAAREEHAMKLVEMRSKHEVGMAAGRMKMAQIARQSKEPAGANV